jgi:hypothetical protein
MYCERIPFYALQVNNVHGMYSTVGPTTNSIPT